MPVIYLFCRVMEFLQMVKDKQPVYDVIFEPLQAIIDVLNIYEVEIPEKSLLQLQELPERRVALSYTFHNPNSNVCRWATTKRLSVAAKQKVAPLQGQEIGKLKSRFLVALINL